MTSATHATPDSKRSPAALPDERAWVRYSRHHELPLSGAGSLALHLFVLGLLLTSGYLAWFLGRGKTDRSQVIVPVKLAGGQGSKDPAPPAGVPGVLEREAGDRQDTDQTPRLPDTPKLPELPPVQKEPTSAPLDDPADVRLINTNLEKFKNLNDAVRKKLRVGDRDKGSGPGPGGPGGPRANLSPQDMRMQRWSMQFDTRNGEDYLRQLQALGAILAIPTAEDERQYQVVRDLAARPVKLLTEDLSQIQRIYWVDDKPHSVRALTAALGLSRTPSHFVAFMPRELEDKLSALELKFAGRREDQILETRFKIIHTARGYEPEVVEQIPK